MPYSGNCVGFSEDPLLCCFPKGGEMELDEIGVSRPKDSDPLLGSFSDESTPSSSAEITPPERAGEMKGEDIESAPAACCRICLECDAEPGELLVDVFFFFLRLASPDVVAVGRFFFIYIFCRIR